MMQLFYTDLYIPGQKSLNLSMEETRHLWKVLRKRSGDRIEVTDGRGTRIIGIIEGEQNRQVKLEILEIEKIPFPPHNQLEIGLSIIRPNRLDWAVEKLTELGVEKIVPLRFEFSSERSVKLEHLKRIAISAIKQSHQYYLPEIHPPMMFAEWLQNPGSGDAVRYAAVPHTRGLWTNSLPENKNNFCQLIIGPEGGYHPNEINLMEQFPITKLHLGPHILRTETAAVTGTALIKSYW